MSLSERILGKKNVNGRPHIAAVTPSAALPGGEVRITGGGLKPPDLQRPKVRFGTNEGAIVVSSDDFVVARVPDGASSGPLLIESGGQESNAIEVRVAIPVADELHPVTNPAIDAQGNIYATFSGARGQKAPVSVFKIDTDYTVQPLLTDIMNATALAFDRDGVLYVSSRYDGVVYRIGENGAKRTFAEGMGIATGVAFDKDGNLYVGDRSGTIFKISRKGETFVFATMEPSVSAYHLAFSPANVLHLTGPTNSSFDAVFQIDDHGNVSEYYRGLGRPQGMAFDTAGNLYVASSLGGKRGIVRITPERQATLAVAGNHVVGLCFAPGKAAIIATNNAVYYLNLGVEGMPLFG